MDMQILSQATIVLWLFLDCELKEYTFSANRNSMDGRMDFYVNGTNNDSIVYSVQFNNVNTVLITSPNISLSAGDLLRLKWNDEGQNPRDAVSTFDFLIL